MRIELHLRGNEYFRDFQIYELIWKGGKIEYKALGKLRCHDVGIVKYSAPTHFPSKALYVRSKCGDSFYYHPRYKRWFKNLTDSGIELYFSRLSPEEGLDKNLRRKVAQLSQEVKNE